jgi:deazaflavin-dependent oxidoreductase (nitroreductase family)
MMMSMTITAKAPAFVSALNPIARRVLHIGPLLGPNALITVRGRKTGVPRTTPVAVVEIGGRRWVIGTFGEVNWVRNLRSAGEATLSVGHRDDEVKAVELDLEQRTAFFRDVLKPYALRLPVGALLLRVLGAREIVDDPAAAAERRPVFELRAA